MIPATRKPPVKRRSRKKARPAPVPLDAFATFAVLWSRLARHAVFWGYPPPPSDVANLLRKAVRVVPRKRRSRW